MFAALVSGGKDSLFAAYYMVMQGWEPVVLIKIQPETTDSYMFHTVNLRVVEKQAECMGLPLTVLRVSGRKEDEVEEFSHGLRSIKDKYCFEALVTGGVSSEYQRTRFDSACEQAGIKCFSPLWHKNPETLFKTYLEHGFKFVFSGVYALGLDQSWLGRIIGVHDLEKLLELNRRYGVSIIGEGGEYESLVLDCPLFVAGMLRVKGSKKRVGPYSHEFIVEEVRVVPKNVEGGYVDVSP